MQRWIVLIGMMGSGKTAVGRALAERSRLSFVDADEEIERAAAMTVAEIFRRDGEAFFRDREAQVVARLLGGRPGVMATGGGAWMAQANRAAIEAAGVSVWLDAGIDVLWQRLRRTRGRETRPLLAADDSREALASLLRERVPVYALAKARVPVGAHDGVGVVADRVLEAVRPAMAS